MYAGELFCFRHFVQPKKLLISTALLCSFDFSHDNLTIFDGASAWGPYCGDSLPPSNISSSNHLLIYFQSDQIVTDTGFKLEYNATSKNSYKIDNCKIVIVFPGCKSKYLLFSRVDIVLLIFYL